MTKLRTRGAPVDYTDFLSPAAKAPPGRGSKRKDWDEEDEEEDAEDAEEEEELVVVRKKTEKKKENGVAKKPKTSKKKREEEEAEEELAEVKAKPKTKAKASQRFVEVEEDNPKPKPKPKVKKALAKEREVAYEATTTAMAVVSTATTTSKSSRIERSAAVATSAPLEMQELRKKYEALREFRESETERLLKEAKVLAKEEKRTYEKLVAKLKSEVAALSSRAQQTQIDHKSRVEELQTEHKLRVETLKREREDSVAANERLRRQIKELEAEAKRAGKGRQAISRADAAAVARAGDNSVELSQAKKLLELYRLITSTELRLIETLDEEEDEEPESYTDVACAVVDSVTGKRFTFDLAVPHDAKEEVEFVPSETQSAGFKTPSYLQEELSFKRSELTKFMRTLLDVVIRKKAADGAKR